MYIISTYLLYTYIKKSYEYITSVSMLDMNYPMQYTALDIEFYE